MKINQLPKYKQFKKECDFYSCEHEYPGWDGEQKYIIITSSGEKDLREKYPDIMNRLSPFIILSEDYKEPFRESKNNNAKFEARGKIDISYEELEWSIGNAQNFDSDKKIAAYLLAGEGLEMLTEVQIRRFLLYFSEEMTYESIASIESVAVLSVRESIVAALKKISTQWHEISNAYDDLSITLK